MNQDEIFARMIECVDFYKFLSSRSEPTGSSEYGIGNPADYDRFCTKENLDAIVTEAGNMHLEVIPSASAYACVERSVNIIVQTKIFHIFVVKESDIIPFRLATMATAQMCTAYPVIGAVKALRVQYFRSVRDMAMMWGSLLVSGLRTKNVAVEDGKVGEA
jgi:hypothetical protein